MAETSMDWASLVPVASLAAVALGALAILGVSMFFSGLPPESGRRIRRSTGPNWWWAPFAVGMRSDPCSSMNSPSSALKLVS